MGSPIEITCECKNSGSSRDSSLYQRFFIDTKNGEVVCLKCGVVNSKKYWNGDFVEE